MKEERQLGLFAWIREGVRRAVVLGFSDAMTEVGTRGEDEDLSPRLAASLREGLTASADGRTITGTSTESGRKRLGRSLEQLNQAAAKPA